MSIQSFLLAGICSLAVLAASPLAAAQALPTASRLGDLQVGGTFSFASPDYGTNWHGYGFYGDFDFRHHLGVEAAFHQVSGAAPILYERTYEIGPRFLYPIHERFVPYGKAMVGRGVFNFAGLDSSGNPIQIANLAFNMASVGGGLDLRVLPGLNVRVVDFEYQRWPSFPPHGLSPSILSFGVAYHFHGRHGLTR